MTRNGSKKKLISKTRFKCVRCGGCCAINGYVYTTLKDIPGIAKFLGLSIKDCRKRYTRKAGNRIVLKGTFRGSCPFLKNRACVIYPVRPEQCRTFPFWKGILEDGAEFKDASTYCAALRKRAGIRDKR